MIEQPPSYKHDEETIHLMFEIQKNGLLKSIQDEYLYWDKINILEAEPSRYSAELCLDEKPAIFQTFPHLPRGRASENSID